MARVRLQPLPRRRPGHRGRCPASRFLLSRNVGCREAPLNHPCDKRLLGQAGDGIDPRGAVAAVPTAQVEREFSHAHAGMGAWMGQHRGGVIPACNEEGYLQRTLESINPTVLQDIRPKAPTSRISQRCCM